MNKDLRRLHAIIDGRVQGVSFRHHTRLKAVELDVTGWVRNRHDGKVEVIVEGTKSQLDEMVEFLYEGSPHAQVKDVEIDWEDATGEYARFETRYLNRDY